MEKKKPPLFSPFISLTVALKNYCSQIFTHFSRAIYPIPWIVTCGKAR